MTLQERAQHEYEVLMDEDYGKNKKPKIPNCEGFDFMTSPDDTKPVPIHEIEIRREDIRRHGHADRDTSKQEFAASLGIDVSDTRDPDSGHSVLEVTEALRSYFGDPEDEAFRSFRRNLVRVSNDILFLKENSFVGADIQVLQEQLRSYDEFKKKQGAVCGQDGVDDNRGAPKTAVDERALETQYSRAHLETLRQYREKHTRAE